MKRYNRNNFSECARKVLELREKENSKPCQGCGYNDPSGCLRVDGCWLDEEKETVRY